MDLVGWWSKATEPIFVVSGDNRIVGWNRGCEELTGVRATEAIGRRCFGVVGFVDVFGNPYCCPSCPVMQLKDARQEVRPFEVYVSTPDRGSVRVRISVLIVDGTGPDHPLSIYVLRRVGSRGSSVDASGNDGRTSVEPPTGAVASSKRSAPVESPLTDREIEVLQLLAKGVSTRETAQVLTISPTTVRNHVANILRKLDVSSRLAAVAYAREMGLID